ncbi:MAG TPA: hypothetical protein VJV79_09990 [Polyangiaceae bacterium]|nr:hypothetical protein [Polyangiaceae bacterium]
MLRVRLALVSLLGAALDYYFAPKVAPSGGALALLCGVLSAAVSATVGLLRDASVGVSALFSADVSPAFRLGQRLSLCFGEQVFPFDICAEAGPFPSFSWHSTVALMLGSALLFGCGVRPRHSPKLGQKR